jgi:hypothetical protein
MLDIKGFWTVMLLKSRQIQGSSSNGIFAVFGKNCGKNRINTSTTEIHRKIYAEEQAQKLFLRLVKEYAEKEGITEQPNPPIK